MKTEPTPSSAQAEAERMLIEEMIRSVNPNVTFVDVTPSGDSASSSTAGRARNGGMESTSPDQAKKTTDPKAPKWQQGDDESELSFDITKVGQLDTSDWFDDSSCQKVQEDEEIEKLISSMTDATSFRSDASGFAWPKILTYIRTLESKLQVCQNFKAKTFPELENDSFDAGYARAVKDMKEALSLPTL